MVTSAVATVNQQYGAVNILTTITPINVLDTMSRTAASGWGVADTGQAYQMTPGSGSIAAYSVNGSVAQITMNVVNNAYVVNVPGAMTDVDFLVDFDTSIALPTGADTVDAIDIRVDPTQTNFYRLAVYRKTTNIVTLELSKFISGGQTIIIAQTTVPGVNAFTTLRVRFRAIGSLILAKAWQASGSEPDWLISTTDTAVPGPGFTRGFALLSSGNTNTLPVTHTWDNLAVTNLRPPATTLVRVTPDGVQTPVRNSPVFAPDGTIVWWDDEAPLNTPVFYTVTGPQANNLFVTTVTLNSNTVSVTGTGLAAGQTDIGWIKDPRNPSLDVQLNFYMHQSSECTGTGVAITDFDNLDLADNDGEFDLINAAYPTVVEMVRSSPTSTLVFTALRAADVAALRSIFASGRILLVQIPTSYGWGTDTYGNKWIHVKDVKFNRPPLQDYRHQQRIVTAEYREVLAPADTNDGLVGSNGIGVGRSTWAAMKASGLTWNALKLTGVTWNQLAQGQGY